MWIDREFKGSDPAGISIHSGLVPPPPNWKMDYLQMEPSSNQGECQDILFSGLFLRSAKIQTTLGMSGCGENERYIFALLSNTRGTARLNGSPLPEGLAAVCGFQPFEVVLPPTDMFGMIISRKIMREYMNEVEGFAEPEWMQDGIHTISTQKSILNAIRMTHHLVARQIEDPCTLIDFDRRRSVIFSIMNIISSIIIESISDSKIDYLWQHRFQVVRRVREYIMERIKEPIKIGEICRDIGVSRRALQYILQDVLGTNPATFVRLMRLNMARRDFLENENSFKVKDVVDRWGFWHPSRFSGEYRQMFEELPSETLRRLRPNK